MNLAHEAEPFSDLPPAALIEGFLKPCERLHLTLESYFGSAALLPGWHLSPKCTESHLATTVKVLRRGEVQHPLRHEDGPKDVLEQASRSSKRPSDRSATQGEKKQLLSERWNHNML